MSELTEHPWFRASRVAIRIMEDSQPLDPPVIVCKLCNVTLTTLADMDTVASLYTLAAEHTCSLPRTDVDSLYDSAIPAPPHWNEIEGGS